MTEKEARQKIVKLAESYLGTKQGSKKHKEIIDAFNTVKPDGWAMTYTAYWCAAFASGIAIQAFKAATAKKYFPLSANCGTIIQKAKEMGIWKETDSYTPNPGDWILYDWDDTGKGDNTGSPDHVGIVRSVKGKTIHVIEGNKNKAVGERLVQLNGRYIRGFALPKYAALAKEKTKEAEAKKAAEAAKKAAKKKAAAKKKLEAKRAKFTRKLAFVVAYAYKNHFKYDHAWRHCGTSWDQLKKTRKMNCHLMVNMALQLADILKAGQIFWINGTSIKCRGKGTAAAVKKAFRITHPKKGPAGAKLIATDVCGYANNAHTQVYAGKNKKKQPVWYSWGPSDVGKAQPRHRKTYDTKKIMTRMRLK